MGCSSSQSVDVTNTTPVPKSLAPTQNRKYTLIYFDVAGRGELIRF